jgi:glutamyl-tRNA synthetase
MALEILEKSRGLLSQNGFDRQSIEQTLRAAAEQMKVKAGQMFTPIRVAVTGKKNAPPLFETLEVLGRERSLERIGHALLKINAASSD